MTFLKQRIVSCRRARVKLGLLVLCVLLVPVAPVRAQDTSDRIRRLENEVQTLSRAIYKGETPPPGAFSGGGEEADTVVRLQQLETEIRNLNGKLEEQGYQISQLKEQLEKMSGDVNARFGDMEKKAPPQYQQPAQPLQQQQEPPMYKWSSSSPEAGSSEGPPAPAPEAPLGNIASNAADEGAAAYENAFALLKNGQYEGAGNGFQAFIGKYPNHSLVPNAKYWLGETYYVRGDFDKASRIFAEAYQQYPKSPKAPDDLLKLGMSLAGMGKKDDACIALGQIEKEFATGAEPVIRRAKQEMTKFGC